jgi:hypothetical protein
LVTAAEKLEQILLVCRAHHVSQIEVHEGDFKVLAILAPEPRVEKAPPEKSPEWADILERGVPPKESDL